MAGKQRMKITKLGAVRAKPSKTEDSGLNLPLREVKLQEEADRQRRLTPSDATSSDFSNSGAGGDQLWSTEMGASSRTEHAASPMQNLQADLQTVFAETGSGVMATANKAITGMGTVIGKVSKYSDWLGTTLDAKIEELIPGVMIPGATYDQALERKGDWEGAVAEGVACDECELGAHLPDGAATPGGWSDWSWHQEADSAKSRRKSKASNHHMTPSTAHDAAMSSEQLEASRQEVKLWKQRCRELAKENLQLKANCKLRPEGGGAGRRVLSELPHAAMQPHQVNGHHSPGSTAEPLSWQACRQLELTLLHMLEKQGSLKEENANLLTEIQSLQELVDIMACQQITEEGDALEFLGSDGGDDTTTKTPTFTNIGHPDNTENWSSGQPSGNLEECTAGLQPQALDFEASEGVKETD